MTVVSVGNDAACNRKSAIFPPRPGLARRTRLFAPLFVAACAASWAVAVTSQRVAICIGRSSLPKLVGGAVAAQRPRIAAAAQKAPEPLTSQQLQKIQAWEAQEEVLSEEAEEKQTKDAAFPISPEELILRAKYYLAVNQDGVVDESLLADDFEFVGPVIGPLKKEDFIEQLNIFQYRKAFPDSAIQWHHFRVDPFDASRVWFTGRGHGTNTGSAPPVLAEPTKKKFISPPQTCSLRFNERGQVREYTAGYVMDRRQGNQGGLGGLFGVLYAIGKPLPYPEAQPYEWTWQRRLFTWLASLAQ